jgi:hypothetical protein
LREQLHAEALRRGLGQAASALVIGDGAVWIRRLADSRFPQAYQRPDLFPAVQLLAKQRGPDEATPERARRWPHSANAEIQLVHAAGGFAAPPFIHSSPKASRLSQNDFAANSRTRPYDSGLTEHIEKLCKSLICRHNLQAHFATFRRRICMIEKIKKILTLLV